MQFNIGEYNQNTILNAPIDELIEYLRTADEAYFNNEDSLLTDDQYDHLKLMIQRAYPTHPYFTGVGSAVRGDKVKLPYPMGSLNQIYQHQYARWVDECHASNATVVVSDKLDGISGLVVYDQSGNIQIGYTRGDGVEGSDITRHLTQMSSIPHYVDTGGVPYAVRGELIITEHSFNVVSSKVKSRSARPYKNARNMVAGVMNASQNPAIVYDAIDFVAYSIEGSSLNKQDQLARLRTLGFKVVTHTNHAASQLNDDELTTLLNQRRAVSQYAIDGLVIEMDANNVRESCKQAANTLNPPYAVKYKIADSSNYAETRVTGVTFSITKDGYCKPTIQFDPVDLVGVTIRQCTGFNPKFIVDNGIGEGAIIGVVRSGDVIPYCQTVIQPSLIGPAMPPYPGKWTETGVDYIIDNADTNEYVQQQQLVDFFSSIGVDHLGEGNLVKMYEVGLTTPESIINLSKDDMGTAVGSRAIGTKIYDSLTKQLTNIPIHVLMGSHPSMGRGVGRRKMKKLWESFKGDMSKCQDETLITQVEGFSTKTAKKIMAGYQEFMTFLSDIAGRVTLQPYVDAIPVQGNLSGSSIVVTGFRDKELELFVESHGGKIGSAVSKNTTVVIARDPSDVSGKILKASTLGIPVITIEDFYNKYK